MRVRFRLPKVALVALIVIASSISLSVSLSAAWERGTTSTASPSGLQLEATLSAEKKTLNNTFVAWYNANKAGLHLPVLKASTIDSVVVTFLQKDAAGLNEMKQVTSMEEANFVGANKAVALAFEANGYSVKGLDLGPETHTEASPSGQFAAVSSGESMHVFVSTAAIPGPNDMGNWLYISINYFVANFYLFQVTYGENDVINTLFEGINAQNEYNQVTSATTTSAILYDAAVAALGVGLVFAAPSLGITALVGGIIAAILAGAAITASVLAANVNSAYTTLYQSTYANQPAGSKYLWTFFNVNYFYPWITLVGFFASTSGEYGYDVNGNTVTILAAYPILTSTIAPSLSGYANSIAGAIGAGHWTYAGPLNLLVDGSTGPVNVWTYTSHHYAVSDGLQGDGVRVVYATSPSPSASTLFSCATCTGTFGAPGTFAATDTLYTGSSPFTFYIGVEDTTLGFWGNWVQVTIWPPQVWIDNSQGPITVGSYSTNYYTALGPAGDSVRIVYATSPSPSASTLFSCSSCVGTFNSADYFYASDVLYTSSGPFTFYIGVQDKSTGSWGNWITVTIL